MAENNSGPRDERNGTADTNEQTPNEKQNGTAQKEQHPASSKLEDLKDKVTDKKEKIKDKTNPPGGHDATPIPSASDGYTVRFTFVRAENLPMSDYKKRSSDPYLTATLTSPGITKRHKEDPDMVLRTRTIHKNTNPEWNQEWVVAGIPSSGFRLKCRLYDEDPADHDDRLGNVTIHVDKIGPSWSGIKEQSYDVKKRMGSKRAYFIRGIAAMCSREIHMSGRLVISAEVLGKSDPPHGRMYTIGPTTWTKHYSPMIGRLAGTKNYEESSEGKGKTERYDFQANQMQFQGPVPETLYNRFVEFKPFVKGMFSNAGLRGRVLNNLLHHQHARIYNYSNSTQYGTVEPRSKEQSRKFLELVHYDEGGRIFTYVLLLDGLLRFTETGKEFGIDLLSKHTMHSNVNIYTAHSGEFFVRRLKHPEESVDAPDQQTHPADDLPGGPPRSPAPKDPENYELIIDNDSGTYRPKGEFLPDLEKFLKENLPGLHIVTKECTDKELAKMKDGQREMKKKQGEGLQVIQHSDDDISSSDEEALDEHVGGKRHKSKKMRAFEAIEDPKKAAKEMIPGEQSREDREISETVEDKAGEGPSS